MLASVSTRNSLLLHLVFGTAKSARQTTDNLIKNPRLTTRGLVVTPNKSYAYSLPEGLPNRHLYWNNTVQNRLRRKEYNAHKLYKLGVKAIHDDLGVPLHNRTVEEVLFELSNLRILKQSLGRSLINLREIAFTFPEILQTQDRGVVKWALEQMHDRSLSSMTPYEFSTYCYLRKSLGEPATQAMLVHLYKWVEGEVQQPSSRIRPKFFLRNMKYIFQTADVEKETSILFKKEQEFRLFEDVTPDNKPLTSMLPLLFTDLQVQSLQAEPAFNSEHYSFLIKIPGGKGLYDRISRT